MRRDNPHPLHFTVRTEMTKRQEQARSCTEKNSHTASFCEGRKSPSSNPKDNQKGAIEAPCLGVAAAGSGLPPSPPDR